MAKTAKDEKRNPNSHGSQKSLHLQIKVSRCSQQLFVDEITLLRGKKEGKKDVCVKVGAAKVTCPVVGLEWQGRSHEVSVHWLRTVLSHLLLRWHVSRRGCFCDGEGGSVGE